MIGSVDEWQLYDPLARSPLVSTSYASNIHLPCTYICHNNHSTLVLLCSASKLASEAPLPRTSPPGAYLSSTLICHATLAQGDHMFAAAHNAQSHNTALRAARRCASREGSSGEDEGGSDGRRGGGSTFSPSSPSLTEDKKLAFFFYLHSTESLCCPPLCPLSAESSTLSPAPLAS